MKTIWTVSSHSAQFERPSETKVFPTKPKALRYIVSIIEDAKTRGFNFSFTEDPDGSGILRLYHDGNLMFINTLTRHEIEIDRKKIF